MLNKKPVIAIVMTLMVGTVAPIILVSRNSIISKKANEDCTNKIGATHTVIIQNNLVTPDSITAKHCDILTISNHDDKEREIAFGQHDNHVAYNGVTEKVLHQDEQLTFILNRVGDYIFHDHNQEQVHGAFLVVQ